MQGNEGNSINKQPANREDLLHSVPGNGGSGTVESLAAVLERGALNRLGNSSGTSTDSQEGRGVNAKSLDQMTTMRAKVDEKLKVLEQRTDEEIKRIVRQDYMRNAVGGQD